MQAFREFDRGLWSNMTQAEVEADPRWGEGAFERCSREAEYGRVMCEGEGMGELRERVFKQRDALLPSIAPGMLSSRPWWLPSSVLWPTTAGDFTDGLGT